MGTLTMGFSQKNLSIEEGSSIIRYAVDCGINFLDTAQYYDTYRYLKPALDSLRTDGAELPYICSKTLEPDYESAKAAVLECLDELALDRIDVFLLHEVRGCADFENRLGAWKALMDLKAEGLIGAIGISTHHVDACVYASTLDECDVVFPLINKAGLGIRICTDEGDRIGNRAEMERAIDICVEEDMGIFTMKAFGGGNLVEDYRDCLDYATSISGNSCVMVGMASRDEVDAAIAYIDDCLDADYRPDVSSKRLMIDQSDCEACGTCKERCVSQAIYWNANGLASIDAGKCVRCGYCAPVCPVRAIILL